MSFYGSFSARARRTIFLAHSQVLTEGAQEITPEHILSALLKEDPNLFSLLLPHQPNTTNEVEHLLAAAGKTKTMREFKRDKMVLSASSREVIFTASLEKKGWDTNLLERSICCWHCLLHNGGGPVGSAQECGKTIQWQNKFLRNVG